MTGSRQVPHVEDLATGTPTAGTVPVSAGPGLPAVWGAGGGGGGGGGSSLVKLAEVGPLVSPQAILDLPATGTLDQTFDVLVVRGQVRGTVSTLQIMSMLFNPSELTGQTYDSTFAQMEGSAGFNTVNAYGAFGWAKVCWVPSLTSMGAGENGAACFEMTIPNYARTAFWKSYAGQQFAPVAGFQTTYLQPFGGQRRSNNPVEAIQFGMESGSFDTGSWVAVYGLNGSAGGLSVPSPYVKLAEVGPLGSAQATLRLPASGSLPTDAYDTYVVRAKVLASTSTRNLQLQFNDDAGTHYNSLEDRVDATGDFGQVGTLNGTSMRLSRTVESLAGYFATAEVLIERPRDADNIKVVNLKSIGPNDGASIAQTNTGMGLWLSTAAITSITLTLSGADNFAAGSWAAVYGVRG